MTNEDTQKIRSWLAQNGAALEPATIETLIEILEKRRRVIQSYQEQGRQTYQEYFKKFREQYIDMIRREVLCELRTMTIGELADEIADVDPE